MKRKPSWGFFWFWVVLYTVLDLGYSHLTGEHIAWPQINVALEGALLGAAMTWLLAYWKWHKSEGL